MNADSANPRPVDVRRTLQYESHVFTRKLIWVPILCLAAGLWMIFYGSVSDKMDWRPWLGLFIGVGWLIYAFIRLIVPGPPMLVLSPEGLIWRNGFRSLVPWWIIRDVTTTDHDVWFRGTKQTIKNVTVVWVPRWFYNQKIFVRPLPWRSPFWSNAFIHKDDATGIVITAETVSLEPEPLREEIVARWQAFHGVQRASVPSAGAPVELADVAETRTLQYWLTQLVIFLVPLLASGVLYLIVSAIYAPDRDRLTTREAEQATAENIAKQLWQKPDTSVEESRLASREQAPWMFSDDDSFTEPGSTPPQRAGSTRGHRAPVVALDVTRDGFLSASDDGTIKLWDMQKTAPLRDVGLHGGGARAVRVLPGGDTFLSGGDDGQIVVRALADGKVLQRFNAREHGAVRSLAVTADGRRALSLHSRGVVIVWDLEAKALAKMLKDTGAIAAAMSTDGALAAIGSHDGKLFIWDINTGNEPRQIGFHEYGVFAVAFMPDGKRVLSGGGGDYAVRMRDLATGQDLRSFQGHKAVTYSITVSVDGKRFVSGSHDGTSILWNAATGEEITRLDQSNRIQATAFAPDGAILTAGEDRSIRLWSTHGYREREFAGVREN